VSHRSRWKLLVGSFRHQSYRVGGGATRRYPPFGMMMGIANAPPILSQNHSAASYGNELSTIRVSKVDILHC